VALVDVAACIQQQLEALDAAFIGSWQKSARYVDADNGTGFWLRRCKCSREDAGASKTPMHDTSYAFIRQKQ